MNNFTDNNWKRLLTKEFDQSYFKELIRFLEIEYTEAPCFPPKDEIFAAFNMCPLNQVKVVILGQDPYHGIGQANGLAFSVRDGVSHPPSLLNIFKELKTDVEKPYPNTGNLESWAKQGVLLLNATLTVRAHQAGSHQKKGWEKFTNAVIKALSDERKGIVFLLWGNYAKQKAKLIDGSKHHILMSGHPSPLSANRGYWFGNGHFSKTNVLLKESDVDPIQW